MTDGMKNASDVVIIGGGVVGLSVADALARQGASVTVLEASLPGAASFAAAGMLAPLAETRGPGPFLDLALASLRRYPDFTALLREEAETDLAIQGPGMLRVARTEAEAEAQCAAWEWQQETGLPLSCLSADELRRLEPALGPDIRAALFSPEERHIAPRILHCALQRACQRHGVEVRVETLVVGFETADGRVTAVQTPQGVISGGHFIVSGGAWSQGLAKMLGACLPVSPLRGQALALSPEMPLPLRHTLYTHGGYLVPRAGQIIVGATEEIVGFDAGCTPEGQTYLQELANVLVPSLSSSRVTERWAGLRPVSADGLPLLGRLPGWANLHAATGHGRNGILLAPITGEVMAAHLLHTVPPPSAFDPARFGEAC